MIKWISKTFIRWLRGTLAATQLHLAKDRDVCNFPFSRWTNRDAEYTNWCHVLVDHNSAKDLLTITIAARFIYLHYLKGLVHPTYYFMQCTSYLVAGQICRSDIKTARTAKKKKSPAKTLNKNGGWIFLVKYLWHGTSVPISVVLDLWFCFQSASCMVNLLFFGNYLFIYTFYN